MAITLEDLARNAANDAVVDLCDVGGPGKLVIREGTTELVEFPLEQPAFEPSGTAVQGSARAIGGDGVNPVSGGNPLSSSGLAAGTADNYQVRQGNDTLLWSGTVTGLGGGGDLEMTNPNVAVSQPVDITSWAHEQPAS